MRDSFRSIPGRKLLPGALLLLSAFVPPSLQAAGVTLIAEGYESNSAYPAWVSAMADSMTNYFHSPLPGINTNLSIYRLVMTYSGGSYLFSSSLTNGVAPLTNGTGEIVIELDWSALAGNLFDNYASTYNVGWALGQFLMLTNAIPQLNGHSLTEFPIHLIGHSRGGSLVAQLCCVLGTNGIWVDHLTTLDPHPLNNDGFSDPALITDAPVHTYANVLFHDNYYETLDPYPDGEPVAGAYVRDLNGNFSADSGGYGSDYHSDVHLWYYGTIALNTPANDTSATITATERTDWWLASEDEGATAGFYYSLIGGGDRTSTEIPSGLPGGPAIRDGYNQDWNLGGGTNANRTALPSDNGLWPNIIKFVVTGTNAVVTGDQFATDLCYQYAGASNLTLQLFYDTDFNPLNSNSVQVAQLQLPSTGANAVDLYSNLPLATTNVPPGVYAIYGKLSDGVRTRCLYAPQWVQIIPSSQPPVLGITRSNTASLHIAINGVFGQTIVLQNSTNLQTWLPVATNLLTGSRWDYTNGLPAGSQFYRAVLLP